MAIRMIAVFILGMMRTLQRMCLSTDIGIPNPGFDYNEPPFVIPAKSEKCLKLRFMSRFSENNNTSALLPNL